MNGLDPTSNRATSAFPLSVGTSLAFESVFQTTSPSIDPDRKIPQKVNLGDYNEFWINLRTLFRNMMGSLTKEDAQRVNSHNFKDAMIQEMDTIASLIRNEGSAQANLIFYTCEYKKLYSEESKFVVLRRDSTDNQKIYTALQDQAIVLILKELKQSASLRVYDTEINKEGNANKKNALIITHAAYDLLSHRNFSKFDLLESHSGVLKSKSMFYTKFMDGKNLPMIPFIKGMFPVFGDSEHFRPGDIKLKRAVIEMAIKNNWTQLTTLPKIKANIQEMPNRYFADILKDLL
jgi:hypothetical protein